MLRVLHSSDLHGQYKLLLKRDHGDFDIWLDTGDFFDNVGRRPKTGYQIIPHLEASQQERWWGWKKLGPRFADWLDGRPAIVVPGNHDFISLYEGLKRSGVDACLVTPEGVEVAGLRWAGFRQISYIAGEWAGEAYEAELEQLVADTWRGNPDVLVTHSPPSGILNRKGEDYGLSALTRYLAYHPNRIRWHFFGHDHAGGGEQTEEMGVQFFNGACHAKVHQIDPSVSLR